MIATYRGDVTGSVAGMFVRATIEAEIDGTPAIGQTVKARVRLLSDPLGYPIDRERWSRWYKGNIGGKPFSAEIKTATLAGKIAVDWSDNGLAVGVSGKACTPANLWVDIKDVGGTLIKTGERASEQTAPPQEPALTGPQDAIQLPAWHSLGPHKLDPRKMTITRTLNSARNQGDTVRLSFEPLNWRSKSEKNGKSVDGAVVIVWQDGDGYTGGYFDWHGVGQTVKTQANIPGGYLSGKQPPKGAPVWYFLCDLSFRERTNIQPGGTW